MSDAVQDEVRNPYGNAVQVKGEGAGVAVAASRAATEVQAQVVMARKFPRVPVEAMNRILAECEIKELAEVAMYSYPRGDKQVEGPSIRLAEVLARNWGNMVSGTIEVERGQSESSLLAYAWDLETNRMARKEFKVGHFRDTKKGGKQAVTEERDIYEVGANAGARRERACILAIIPGYVVNAAVEQCKKTLRTNIGDPKEAAQRMLDKFAEYGVNKVQIEKRLRHRLESVSAAEIVALGQVYTAIADGYAGVADYFEIEQVDEQKPTGTAATARAAAARAAGRGSKAPQKAPVEETPDERPVDAAQAPQAQSQGPSDQAVLQARKVVGDYIAKAVQPKDRENFTSLLAKMTDRTKINEFYSRLIEQYGDPSLFDEGGER